MNNQILKKIIIIFSIIFLYNINIGNAAEPFIRNYDLIQDDDIKKLDSIKLNISDSIVSEAAYGKIFFLNSDTILFNGAIYESLIYSPRLQTQLVETVTGITTSNSNIVIDTYLSEEFGTTQLNGGLWEIHLWASATNNSCSIQIDAFIMHNDGDSIHWGTVMSPALATTTPSRYVLQYITTDTNVLPTDRLLTRFSAWNRTSTPRNISMYYGGNVNATHIQTPLNYNIVNITKISELQNDSNLSSYNDTLFFQVTNSDTVYSDTSITADTQMDIINDTACFIIYGDSYAVDLIDYDFSYKINISGYWAESSQLVYLDETNNRIVFKADINTFAPETVLFTIKKGVR